MQFKQTVNTAKIELAFKSTGILSSDLNVKFIILVLNS